MNITDLKAWEMQELLLKGEISSRDIVKAHIKNLEEKEEEINAFISYDIEAALKRAEEIDKKIENKEDLGILAGLVISLKDNIITKDFKTTAASKMLENFTAPFDASIVEKIKEQDGIIIGKTNLDEFAMGESNETSYFGPSKNPLDSSRVPGGSSGGSAASLAAGQAALSVGTDTGGSVRKPASYCGLVGIKPSYGLISRYGIISLSNSLDSVGVFGKDVRDASLILEAIYGWDELDTSTKRVDLNIDLEGDIKGLRVGIPKEWIDLEMDPSIREDFEKSINRFKELGASVEEVSLENILHTKGIYRAIAYGDISSNMARYDGIRYGYRAEDYESLDELYLKTRTEAFGEEVKKRILFGTYLLSGDRGDDYYKKAQKLRTLMIEDFNKAFSKVDVLITPTELNIPKKLGDKEKVEHKDFNESVNIAGLPAITIPMGGKDLKTGLQIIGNRFEEEKIIKAAYIFEGTVE